MEDRALDAVRVALSLTNQDHAPVALWVRAKGTCHIFIVTAVRGKQAYTYQADVYAGKGITLSLLCTAPLFDV